MKSTGTRSSNELQWLDYMIGYQNSSRRHAQQGDMLHACINNILRILHMVPGLLCLINSWLFLPTSFRVTLQALGKSYDFPSACKITLKNVDKYMYLTHWGRDKMATIFQTAFSYGFSSMKMHKFRLRFHWHFFPRVQSTIFQHWFR